MGATESVHQMNIFVDSFLTFLETRETRLLSWGFYDSTFSFEEIERLLQDEGTIELREAWAALAARGWTLDRLVGQMEQANLLFRVSRTAMYRTRFAEGVRLLARLRQMFREPQWAVAPRLVSDIKIHLKPRVYPRRDRTPEQCWEGLRHVCRHLEFQQELFAALSRDQEAHLTISPGFKSVRSATSCTVMASGGPVDRLSVREPDQVRPRRSTFQPFWGAPYRTGANSFH